MGIVVSTIPKAGTYMVAELLMQLGLKNYGWHIAPDHKTKFVTPPNGASITWDTEDKPCKMMQEFRKLQQNEFAVCHIPPHQFDVDFTSKSLIIFCHRDLHQVFASNYFFLRDGRRLPPASQALADTDPADSFQLFLEQSGPAHMRLISNLLAWYSYPDVIKISYAKFLKDESYSTDMIRQICNSGDLEQPANLATIWQQVLSAMTPTKSNPDHPNRPNIWTDATENTFDGLHGNELNQRLMSVS